jgi:hypothetical protein
MARLWPWLRAVVPIAIGGHAACVAIPALHGAALMLVPVLTPICVAGTPAGDMVAALASRLGFRRAAP